MAPRYNAIRSRNKDTDSMCTTFLFLKFGKRHCMLDLSVLVGEYDRHGWTYKILRIIDEMKQNMEQPDLDCVGTRVTRDGNHRSVFFVRRFINWLVKLKRRTKT